MPCLTTELPANLRAEEGQLDEGVEVVTSGVSSANSDKRSYHKQASSEMMNTISQIQAENLKYDYRIIHCFHIDLFILIFQYLDPPATAELGKFGYFSTIIMKWFSDFSYHQSL